MVFNAFKSGIFYYNQQKVQVIQVKLFDCLNFKILTPKQLFQLLLTAPS